MPLLKLHWVATYGFIPAVIALILAVVLVSDILYINLQYYYNIWVYVGTHAN